MSRTLVGAALLLVLLAGGILSALWMARDTGEIGDLLEDAAASVLEGQWQQAREEAERARRLWERKRNPGAALADHGPMEQVDSGFALLRFYAETGEQRLFAALCIDLEMRLEALEEAQKISWWNIL